MEKANKCKVTADAQTRRMKYTHCLGPKGVVGLILQFVSENLECVAFAYIVNVAWIYLAFGCTLAWNRRSGSGWPL